MFDISKIESQHIDNHGKARMIRYKSGLTILTSPLPPLNVKSSDLVLGQVDAKLASQFLKENSLTATHSQINDDGKAIGIWVTSEKGPMFNGYIPLKPTKSSSLGKVEKAPAYFLDIVSQTESVLDGRKRDEMTAEYIKQYAIWEYSTNSSDFPSRFIVIPNHNYNISKLGGRLFKYKNDVMYKSDKLIVTSEEMKKRLISYVEVTKFNNSLLVETFQHRSSLYKTFETISEFKSRDGELILNGRNGYIEYYHKKNLHNVLLIPNETIQEPYFYRNPNIKGGSVCIAQNVFNGDLKRALGVADKWEKNKINMGYWFEGYNVDDYCVFDQFGDVIKGKSSSKRLLMETNGKYFALLYI